MKAILGSLCGLLVIAQNGYAQVAADGTRISGRVVDALGQPLPNASVRVAGTARTAITGADGHYTIVRAPAGVFSVEAAAAGFGSALAENIRTKRDSTSVVDFVLTTNPLRGQGAVRSATLIPASGLLTPFIVDNLNSEEMPVPANTSPVGALAGKVAGVTVVRTSNAPGAFELVQLRTPVWFTYDTAPLYVVDGVMLSSEYPLTSQDIESLNVRSIEVIKGPAAGALYGSRGASGVISIRTVRGDNLKIGQTQFTVRNEAGFEYLSGLGDAPLTHSYRVNAVGQYVNATGGVVPRSQRIPQTNGIFENRFVEQTYDHRDQYFRTGLFNTQSISLQQNRASTNFAVAYSRGQQPGIVPDAKGHLRQSVRLNVDQRWRDRLRVGLSVSRVQVFEEPAHVDFLDVLRIDRDVDLLTPEPSGATRYKIIPDITEGETNPFYQQLYIDEQSRRKRTLANLNLSARAFSWLSFDAFGSWDLGHRVDSSFVPRGRTSVNGTDPSSGAIAFLKDTTDNFQFQGGVTATKMLGGLLGRFALRGETERQKNAHHQFQGFALDSLGSPGAYQSRSSWTKTKLTAAVANVGLNLNGRYLGDVLFRREGLSLFGLPETWNSFARGSVAWVLNEERWFPFESFNLFKVHYAVGNAGTRSRPIFRFAPIGSPLPPLTPRLRTEIATERELGLQMVVRNRVQATLAYASVFTKENTADSTDWLLPGPGPDYKLARLKGHAIEGSIQARILTNPKGFQWEVMLVGDRSRRKITEHTAFCFGGALLRMCKGTPPSMMWGNRLLRAKHSLPLLHVNSGAAFDINDEGYLVPVGTGNTWRDGKTKGLWGTTVSVDGRSYAWGVPFLERDANDSRVIDKIGDANPDLQYGFQNTFRYRGFQLYSQIVGQLGGDVYNQVKQNLYLADVHPEIDQSGKPDELRKSAAYYRGLAQFGLYLENFVEDATYARLSEASLGYVLNASQFESLKRIGAERIQIDLVGRNLFTLSKYSGFNPQGNSLTSRIDQFGYPLTRTFTLATSITF